MTSFIVALENLVIQSQAKKIAIFLDIETAIKNRLIRHLEAFIQHHNRNKQLREVKNCPADSEKDKCVPTQFQAIQKKPLLDLPESLEQSCHVQHVLGFNSSKDDLNLIKSYLLPVLIIGTDI